MTEPQYRYGGPVPERVQHLKARRVRRAEKARRAQSRNGVTAWKVLEEQLAPYVHCPASSLPFREEGAEARMPISRARSESWLQSISRIFRGGH